jgi:ornithine cyclodeaminase
VTPLLLKRSDIERRIDPAAARAAVSAVFARAQERPTAPMPLHLDLADGEVHVKAATDPTSGLGIVKAASATYGANAGSDGAILAFDASTAQLRAVLLDGGWLTDLRTAAVSALGVETFAGPQARRVAIVGAGVQARFHVAALKDLRDDLTITVAARRHIAADDLARAFHGTIAATADIEGAVRTADIVITVTPSRTPILRREWIGTDTLVIAVGADAPGKQELEPALLEDADVLVADSPEQAVTLGESQHLQARQRDTIVPLSEPVAGRRPRPHTGLRVCDLTGLGACDAAMVAHVLSR